MPHDETQAPVTEPPAAAHTANSGFLLSQLQAGMAQYLDILQGQQQVMQHCLTLQQQFMSALLNGQVKAGAAPQLQVPQVAPVQTRQPVSVVSTPLPTAPPAPVLPSLPVAAGPPTTPMPAALPRPVLPTPVAVQPAAPTMAPAAGKTKATPATEEFQAALLHIVSERTGYPKEMLDLDAHLEADLGIDSIKRVEIFGALEEHQAVLEGKDEETILDELAGLKTLRRIVEWYDGNRTRMLAEKKNS
jgi:acyl carrier protein